MSVKTTQLVKCDHMHEDGSVCNIERPLSKISATEPMYHLVVTLEVVDAAGAHQVVQEDVHLCYWDLYHHLAGMHDQASVDMASRKAAAEQEVGLEAVI